MKWSTIQLYSTVKFKVMKKMFYGKCSQWIGYYFFVFYQDFRYVFKISAFGKNAVF